MAECKKCGCELTVENIVTIVGFEGVCYQCYSKDKPQTVCLDFDGVMAKYDGWKGADHHGEPTEQLEWFLNQLYTLNFRIVVFTTRDRVGVERWLDEHGLSHYISMITNEKIPAHCYVDDRAVCHRGDFLQTMIEVVQFRPHWKTER